MLSLSKHARLLCLSLAVSACGADATSDTITAAEGQPQIACALGGNPQFHPDCTLERSGSVIVIRHPDGGFRRFELGEGENRIRPADGSENALWQDLGDGMVEVAIGDNRYRLKPEPESPDAAAQ